MYNNSLGYQWIMASIFPVFKGVDEVVFAKQRPCSYESSVFGLKILKARTRWEDCEICELARRMSVKGSIRRVEMYLPQVLVLGS
jgi:hypothetical protein